jgi:hypothetical protein
LNTVVIGFRRVGDPVHASAARALARGPTADTLLAAACMRMEHAGHRASCVHNVSIPFGFSAQSSDVGPRVVVRCIGGPLEPKECDGPADDPWLAEPRPARRDSIGRRRAVIFEVRHDLDAWRRDADCRRPRGRRAVLATGAPPAVHHMANPERVSEGAHDRVRERRLIRAGRPGRGTDASNRYSYLVCLASMATRIVIQRGRLARDQSLGPISACAVRTSRIAS